MRVSREAVYAKSKAVASQVSTLVSNPWVRVTQYVIVGVVGLIIIFDLFLAFNEQPGDTISEILKGWAYKRLFVITWAWGVLAGHLFLTNAQPPLGGAVSITVLLAVTLALLVAGLPFKGTVPVSAQIGLLLVGTVAGYLLWPQRPVA